MFQPNNNDGWRAMMEDVTWYTRFGLSFQGIQKSAPLMKKIRNKIHDYYVNYKTWYIKYYKGTRTYFTYVFAYLLRIKLLIS